jgi:hypothetical protein
VYVVGRSGSQNGNPGLNPNRNGLVRTPPLYARRKRGTLYVGVYPMNVCKTFFVGVFLLGAMLAAPRAHSQTTPKNCTASQQAAVECFVANAVTTNLTTLRHGMTLPEFESYGVAVSRILQTHSTYLVLVGLSSAVADAMPPVNANGTANPTAQNNAIMQAVSAASRYGFTPPPTGVSLADLQHFSLDVASAMNDNQGALELLTPGISLRIIDSYIITATTNGQVSWTEVDAKLSTAVANFISSGLMKLPPRRTLAQLTSFADSLAQIIQTYKVATNRKALSAD